MVGRPSPASPAAAPARPPEKPEPQPLASFSISFFDIVCSRVSSPFTVLLYKTCPTEPERFDVIGLFVQPVEEDLSLAYAFVLVVDDQSTMTGLIHFQQTIFLQDRIILENQRRASCRSTRGPRRRPAPTSPPSSIAAG